MKIGIVDTTFARFNMGAVAIDELGKIGKKIEILRRTVPGIKDLAVECKILLEKEKCDIVMALGMVGGAPIDNQCAHEASLGIQQAKLMTNKHIIEVFVHENEAWNEKELADIAEDRVRKHVHNAVNMILDPKKLETNAGLGIRQGREDEGSFGKNRKVGLALVIGEFNKEISEIMEKSAEDYSRKNGAEIAARVYVPGVYDMPIAIKKLLMEKNIDAVVLIGAIITGETKHDEIIAYTTANEAVKLSMEFNKPVTLGIIGPGATEKNVEERKIEYAERATAAAIELVKKLRR